MSFALARSAVAAGLFAILASGCQRAEPVVVASAAATPAPATAPVSPADRADAALAAFLAREQVAEVPLRRDAPVDLDGDGRDDLLMPLEGPGWCGGGGCTMLVFHGEADGYRLVNRTTVTQAPIAASAQRHNGWRDLLVSVGGDGTQAGVVALQFNGEGYPTDPTLLALLADGSFAQAQTLIE